MRSSIAVSELARLNFLLAEIYADCVQRTQRRAGVSCELVGCHGQTHLSSGRGRQIPGPPHCLHLADRRRLGAGRRGWEFPWSAIFVRRIWPPADWARRWFPSSICCVFRHPRRGRIVQNIGGIGNLTAIPAGPSAEQVRAFDTGPGNMVIDAVCATALRRSRSTTAGKLAAKGNVLPAVLAEADEASVLPRARGRARRDARSLGANTCAEFLKRCGRADKHDVLATATALTARSIARRCASSPRPDRYHDLFVSGGGTRNLTLMEMLRSEVAGLGIEVLPTDAAGVPSQAKEAIAFAVLAYQSWHRDPSNLPGATGAAREVILGKVSYA